jgi:hypothetical protein
MKTQCQPVDSVSFAIFSTLEGWNVGFTQHDFVWKFESPWYYWWAAWVSIPAPED